VLQPTAYSLQPTAWIRSTSGTVNNYSFELAGNKLTVSGGDLKQPMVFEREGAASSGGLGGGAG
jgi:hypothetical protein